MNPEKEMNTAILKTALTAAAMGLSLQAAQVQAQNYPSKPVRVVVPLAPGGATDIQARLFSQKLTQGTGQSFVVENRAGAGGLIAFKFVVSQAPGDGYTLLATSPGFTNVPALYDKPPFDPVKDFEPIILMSKAPYVLVVTPSFPATSMKEFLAWARANPGKLNFALSGVGTTIHLGAVWMEDAAGIKTVMVPYKGTGPATQDLIAGQVHAAFSNPISAGPFIKAGKMRPLAVTSPDRSSTMPDLPTFAESGLKDFDVTTWHGWLGPRGTPQNVVKVMNAELNKVLKAPEVVKIISDDGGTIIGGSPDGFRKHIGSEIERWKALVKLGGIKPPAN
jgi:tripartite-type tricarboxylate transporter receptor subunit TctC